MTILLVVSRPARLRALARILAGDLELLTAEDGAAAGSLLLARRADAALVDVDVAPEVVELCGRQRVPVVACGRHPAALAAAVDAGAIAVAPPDDDPALLVALVRRASAAPSPAADDEPVDADHVVAVSPAMRVVMRTLRAAARTWAPVAIVGDPGSGRSLLARRLHEESTDGRPLLALRAADLAAEGGLELLRRGLRGGAPATVVLDGLDELDDAAHVHLRAELEARAHAAAPPRVRLIAVARGELRAGDAGPSRLAPFPIVIDVPPLRQRLEDLPLLAQMLLVRAARRLGRPEVRRVGTEAVRAMRKHAWPGQVRELEGMLEQAVLVAEGPVLVPSDLPLHEGARQRSRDAAERMAAVIGPELLDLPHPAAKAQAMAAFDVAYAEAMLARSGGNISVAARAAGMDRSNFKRLVRRAREPRREGSPPEARPSAPDASTSDVD